LLIVGAITGIATGEQTTRPSGKTHGKRVGTLTELRAPGNGTSQVAGLPNDRASPIHTPGVSASSPAPDASSAVLASSLMGTSVDGALETDAYGHFVPTAAAVRLFDYFLSTEGEIPARDLRQNVRSEAERALPPGEVEHVMVLFDRYVDCRRRAAARMAEVGDRRAALAAMHRAREESFGAEDAQRMFGEAETIATAVMNEAEISASDLPADERARRMGEQEENLPPRLRAIHVRRALDAEELDWRSSSLGR
jgi:lipase chaperone LimK